MSHFSTIKTQFKDLKCLVKSLCEVGDWNEDQIEIHKEATNLYGYQGDKRETLANVIIRRKNVGYLSNDIGFLEQADGSYSAIISDHDKGSKYGTTWNEKLNQRYGVNVIKQEADYRGYSYTEEYDKKTQMAYVTVTTY